MPLPEPQDLSQIIFLGAVRSDGAHLAFVHNGNLHASIELPHRQHHSDAFHWGYGGSGPADLALSILDYLTVTLGEKRTVKIRKGKTTHTAWILHHDFKWQYVAHFQDDWSITADEIHRWLQQQRRMGKQKS